MEAFNTFGDLKDTRGLAVLGAYCQECGLSFPPAIMEKVFWNWSSSMLVTSGK